MDPFGSGGERDAVGEDVAADDIGISLSCPSVPESGVSDAH